MTRGLLMRSVSKASFAILVGNSLAALACGTHNTGSASATKVTNGVEAAESDHPATTKLDVLNTHMCTGTFLNDTTVLTARHCIDKQNPAGNVRVDTSAGGTAHQVTSINVFVIPGEDSSLPEVLNYETDLAIVVFPEGTGAGRGIAANAYPKLSDGAPSSGDWVHMLGFGGTDMSGSNHGVLRSGDHEISFVDDGGFSWVAFSGEQNVAPGDSGSAAYVNDKIVGVATLAGDTFGLGMVYIAGFRGTYDAVAQELFESAIHCGAGAVCAAEFRN